jgi:hypothetical protein
LVLFVPRPAGDALDQARLDSREQKIADLMPIDQPMLELVGVAE